MASASCSYYISFIFALLCMCIHVLAGAFILELRNEVTPSQSISDPLSNTPRPVPTPKSNHNNSAPSPTPGSVPSPAPTPHIIYSWSATVPSLSRQSPQSSAVPSESAKHKPGRILGLVLISFAGLLQVFVVLFLFIKRRQMLKHLHGSRDNHNPTHIWANAYKEADTDCKQLHFGITVKGFSFNQGGHVFDVAKMDIRLNLVVVQGYHLPMNGGMYCQIGSSQNGSSPETPVRKFGGAHRSATFPAFGADSLIIRRTTCSDTCRRHHLSYFCKNLL